MKKLYFLFISILMLGNLAFSQVLITELADPNNDSNARFIELYNLGASAVDFTEGNGWQIDKYTNASGTVSLSLDLTGTIQPGAFYIIAYDLNDGGVFQSTYGFAPDQLDNVNNGVAGSNGDDDIVLVDGNDVIVDFFGIPATDNSGTCAEYEDGRAERLITVSGPNPTFDEAEWNVWADSDVTGCTSHQNAPRTAPSDFDPGAWGTPTCGLSLLNPSAVCDNITPGTDTYTASVEFTGGGTATYTVTADAGVVDLSGGDPSVDATGTITVTGLTEGIDVIITVQDGGVCDVNSTVFAPDCVPSLALPLYEGFDYTVSQNLGDQANWEDFNSGDNILVAGPGGLTYTGLASDSQTGNHVAFSGSGAESKIEFTGVSSGPVYASFLLNLTDISAMTDLTDGGYFAALAGSDSGYDARVWVRPNTDPVGTTYDISITSLSSGGAGAPFAGSYNVGDTVLIVLSYDASNGMVKGWVNPTSFGGAEPAPDFSETDSNPAAVIDRFVLRQDSTGETPSVLFDELRIGSSYAEVTPQTLSTTEFNANDVAIFPNPTNSGFVTINTALNDVINVEVYDMLGKQVKKATMQPNTNLNVSNLRSGIYIIRLEQNNATITKKLVIK
ncbi:T9SS type A sorting domain-containing protein [Winogradskyella sp. DF17]|uniref:T9SS type A sorting domain-containing protein n=1 Tax=Winogradskyella pelagia TaxID=2819984 RepID=A0ABS3T1H7_9FLAO|nr:T9SS type A sorting domain-containing protein [Winogradskyella sp. DF17]MBO3115585.1 T9SS type A sorting domain-containing protein [Winogradskyella sp. DF17]